MTASRVLAAIAASLLLATACSSEPEEVVPLSDAVLEVDDLAGTDAPTSPDPSPEPTPTATGSPAETSTATTPAGPQVTGDFGVEVIDEASGVVAAADPDVVWIIDDGAEPVIHAVRLDGTILGQVTLRDVQAVDLEDIAAGPCAADDDRRCLYIADIGDNTASRSSVQVHRVVEPPTTDLPGALSTATATLTYPGGPVDAEALLVDGVGRLIVLSKEEGQARVLVAEGMEGGPVTETGVFTIPPPALAVLTQVGGLSITGGDLAPSGDAILLRTYDQVLELTPPPGSGPPDPALLFSWDVAEQPVGFEPQGEAVGYLSDDDFVTVSEQTGQITVVRRGT